MGSAALNYAPLMDLAMELGQFQGYLDSQGLKARNQVQIRYNAVLRNFVYGLLKDGSSAAEAAQVVDTDIDEMMEVSEPWWHPIYDEVRGDILAQIERDSQKKPWQRTLRQWLPVILAIVVAGVYFGVRLYSATPVSQPVESSQGLRQRADALAKALRYDDWASGGRGGFIKGILLWPIEPTEAEVRGAAELAGLVFEGGSYLQTQGEACGVPMPSQPGTLTSAEAGLLQRVADHLRSPDVQWSNPPVNTVLDPIRAAHRC